MEASGNITDGAEGGARGRAAYDRVADEVDGIDVAATTAYGLEAVYAAAQAIAISHRLQPFRERIAALPEFDMRHLDRLEDYAVALRFVHHTLINRAQRVRQLPELAEQGYALRRMLMAYADLLVIQGVFDDKRVARLREGSGYRDLMSDLESLALIYREHPQTYAPGAPIGEDQLDRAEAISHDMALHFGLDKDSDLSQDALLEVRRKIAHLLVSAQRQLRRAMAYLRFEEGDAAALVPSLYMSGRPRRTAGGQEESEPNLADDLAAAHAAMHEQAEAPHAHPHDNPFVDA